MVEEVEDDVIEQAGRNLRRAMQTARVLEGVASFVLWLGIIEAIALAGVLVFGDTDDRANILALGFWTLTLMAVPYAVLRGLASIVTLIEVVSDV